MSFNDSIDVCLYAIELEAERIRKAAGRRNLYEIREALGRIRTSCTEIGHSVAEKEVELWKVS